MFATGVLFMSVRCDLPPIERDVAALPWHEFDERFAAACRDRNRDEFIRLGQRLVRAVVLNLRVEKLRLYGADAFSEGIIGLLRAFDRKTVAPPNPIAYFRIAVRGAILNWACRQKILPWRRNVPRPATVLDTDMATLGDDTPTFIAQAPAANDRTLGGPLSEQADALLAAALDATDRKMLALIQSGEKRPALIKQLGIDNLQIHRRITFLRQRVENPIEKPSASALRRAGYAYATIAKYLGVPVSRVRAKAGPPTKAMLQRRERECKRQEIWSRWAANPRGSMKTLTKALAAV
jgi:hypothetical protein